MRMNPAILPEYRIKKIGCVTGGFVTTSWRTCTIWDLDETMIHWTSLKIMRAFDGL